MEAKGKSRRDDKGDETCVKCGSSRIVSGTLGPGYLFIMFRADGLLSTFHPFSPLHPDRPVQQANSLACLDCGCFWSSINPDKLKAVIQRDGNKELQTRLGLSRQDGPC